MKPLLLTLLLTSVLGTLVFAVTAHADTSPPSPPDKASVWTCVRDCLVNGWRQQADGVGVMLTEGNAGDSAGFEANIPIGTAQHQTLQFKITGTPGAQYSVQLKSSSGMTKSSWKYTPTTEETVTVTSGGSITAVQFYILTKDGKRAENRIRGITLTGDGVPLVLHPPPAKPARAIAPAGGFSSADWYTVVWDSPGTDAYGSMPLGNGDIGLNAWAQADGTIHILISKTDAWDNSSRLVKVGEVIVRFDANSFTGKFKQELDLQTGSILFQDNIRLWVDAHHPVIHLTTDLPATATVQLWRTNRQEIAKLENSDIMKLAPKDLLQLQFSEPETRVDATTWYHHNTTSLGPAITAKIQGLIGFPQSDPILDRIFGGSIVKTPHGFDIHVLTQQPSKPEKWLAGMKALIQQAGTADFEAHQQWWADFWDRSWIRASSKTSGNDATHVSQMYALQRFVTACAGRGAYPIKFNGSIFTMPKEGDSDYRRWGPGHDWTPDQDHGGVLMADKTIVAGKVVDGKIVDLQVTPESRRKDVVIRGDQ